MSIWGNSDPKKLPDDPYKIEPNWYLATAVEVYSKDGDTSEGEITIIIKWKIDQPGSRFHGLTVQERNSIYTLDDDDLTGEMIQRNSLFKKKLREGFDLDEDEIVSFETRMAIGKKAYIKVENNPDKNNPDIVWNNTRGCLSPRLFDERYGEGSEESVMAQGGGVLINEI